MKRPFLLAAIALFVVGAGALAQLSSTSKVGSGSVGGGGSGMTAAQQAVQFVVAAATGELSAEVVAAAGVVTWLQTANSSNLRSAMSDETGSGELVFSDSPTMIAPTFGNGTIEAGSVLYSEDSDNGSSTIRVRGQDSLAGSRVLRLPDPGPAISGTAPTVTLGVMNGPDQFYMHDEMICGIAPGTNAIPSCFNMQGSQTSATWNATPSGGASTANNGLPPGYARGTLDATGDVVAISGQNRTQMLMMDNFRVAARVRAGGASTTALQYVMYIGAHEAGGGNTTAPAHGAWFSYTNTDANGTPNWTINLESGSADCGIVVSPTNWTKLALWYEAGTGVHYYVDGVECSNSPLNADPATAAGEEFSWFNFKAVSIAGAAGPTFDIDYVTLGPTPFAGR